CFSCRRSGRHLALPSLPTRRSSDLTLVADALTGGHTHTGCPFTHRRLRFRLRLGVVQVEVQILLRRQCGHSHSGPIPRHTTVLRSEEHTSELQSRENLGCRLLLEKK